MTYDYLKAIKEDIKEYFSEELLEIINCDDEEEKEDMANDLEGILLVTDCITGNESGSYWCNRFNAEEAICHNMNLALEAYREFGYNGIAEFEAERIDVTIRCYLLNQAIYELIEEM